MSRKSSSEQFGYAEAMNRARRGEKVWCEGMNARWHVFYDTQRSEFMQESTTGARLTFRPSGAQMKGLWKLYTST